MTAVTVSFRWLDILEKEFDKAFVDLELLVGEQSEYIDLDDCGKVQNKLEALSSCFAQLTHKAQTIFQSNAKLEAELVHLRREASESRAQLEVSRLRCQELTNQLHTAKTQLHELNSNEYPAPQSDPEYNQENILQEVVQKQELRQLLGENSALRRLLLSMQGELCGARLAAKYLDKELAGRIQQLQLLGREVRWQQEHDKVWRQLEAEINLHRHKTVVRACRANIPAQNGMQTVCEAGAVESSFKPQQYFNGITEEIPRPDSSNYCRVVTIRKEANQSLGMSVTGGREHGVPIVVSVVHPDTPAFNSGNIYVGDAIIAVNGEDLRQMSHTEAVALLSQPADVVTLQLTFVPPEDDDTSSLPDDPFAFKYRVFDDDVVSVASSVVPSYVGPHASINKFNPRYKDSSNGDEEVDGRLSRASLDSVRGSQDNLEAESILGDESTGFNTIQDAETIETVHAPSQSLGADSTQHHLNTIVSRTLDSPEPDTSSYPSTLTTEPCSLQSQATESTVSSTAAPLSDSSSTPVVTPIPSPAALYRSSNTSPVKVSQPPTPVHRKSVPGSAQIVLRSSSVSSDSSAYRLLLAGGVKRGTSLQDEVDSSGGDDSTRALLTPLQELEKRMTTAL